MVYQFSISATTLAPSPFLNGLKSHATAASATASTPGWRRSQLMLTICGLLFLPFASANSSMPEVPQTQPQAQPQPQTQSQATELSLTRALQLARRTLPELAAAQKEVAASQGQLVQAQTLSNPELSYSSEDWRGNNSSQTVQLNWPVELGNKRELRSKSAQSAVDLAQTEQRQVELRLFHQVRQAYFELLLAQQQTALGLASLELAQAFSLSVQQRIRAGKLAAAEQLKANVAENTAQLELIQAQQQEQGARLQLQSLVADRSWQHLSKAPLAPPELPELDNMQVQLSTNPVVQKARIEWQQRQHMSALERAKRLPDLTLSMGVKRSREIPGQQVLIGVSLPLMLFDRNQGNLNEALQREAKAADDLAALTRQLHAELQQNHSRYLSLQAQIKLLQQQILPDAQRAYQAARLGFDHGKFGFLEVLDAQRSLFSQQALHLKTLSEAYRLYFEMASRFALPLTTVQD